MIQTISANLVQNFAGQIRAELGDIVQQIILFGSRSRQDHADHSDYDIAVIAIQNSSGIREKILDIEMEMLNKHDAMFSTILYDLQEWEKEKNTPLGWNIQDDGLIL